MDWNTKLINLSAWVAFLFWVAGEITQSGPIDPRRRLIRVLWTLGGSAMVVHLALAFALKHLWSHDSAVAETARQTAAVFRINWGGGVWFNYALATWWGWDIGKSWSVPERWIRPGFWRTARRSFFWFMWLNGTVIFVSGGRRWIALFLCLAVLTAWILEFSRSREVKG